MSDRQDIVDFYWGILAVAGVLAAVTLESSSVIQPAMTVSVTQPTITISVTQPTITIQARNRV